MIFIFFAGCLFANTDNLSVSAIPDSLKKDAYSVVRFSNTIFDYKSEKIGVEKHSIAISVLDKKGKDLANFGCSGDKFRELSKFSAKLYDANGNLLRKFKLSDVVSTEYSSHLATDGKYYFFEAQTATFPFTIHYEYEISWKNGIFSFPIFIPQQTYSTSVETANYQLNLPQNLKIQIKALNITDKPIIVSNKETIQYTWEVKSLKAIESESFAPPQKEFVPMLYISPEKFIYDKIEGDITDWATYGKWMAGLQQGRNALPETFKNKIVSMTKDADSDYDKIKILYDYLGETTRYVSIQLGIGGFQPMFSAEVNKTGFGDCKALSFYLKSMLEVIDIPSNYVEIRSDRRNKQIFPDYATFYETNHAILQVPLGKDTLWLECTNPKVPFGYVHTNIAGHDAIEIKETGGQLCRLPDYPDSLNIDKNVAKVKLSLDGSATVEVSKEYGVKVYDSHFGFNLKKMNEQIDKLRREINLPNATVNSVQVTENKSPFPNFQINYNWETVLYGTKTGNRLFIPVNPFRSDYSWFKKKDRKHDIDVWEGFKDVDSIFISIPEAYEIESLPKPLFLSTAYGDFKAIALPKDDGIVVTQSFYFPTGRHKVSEYNEIRDFFDKINAAYNGKIILRKK